MRASLRQLAFRGILILSLASICGSIRASAQATATAKASGTSLAAGGGYANYQADYGKRRLGGYTIYADYERTPRWGLEFEARALRFNQEFGTHQTTLLLGPRYTYRKQHFVAYGKLLVGYGLFHFPYNYAEGSYFVLAPGGGIDVPIGQSRYTIRAADIEYQSWPNFTYGGLHPWGYSVGFAARIF